MPVAGLVLTLAPEPALRALAREALGSLAGLTVGPEGRAHKLPVVTECDSLEAQQELWLRVANTPGVLQLELAFEDFSDVEPFTSEQLPQRWTRRRAPEEPRDGSP